MQTHSSKKVIEISREDLEERRKILDSMRTQINRTFESGSEIKSQSKQLEAVLSQIRHHVGPLEAMHSAVHQTQSNMSESIKLLEETQSLFLEASQIENLISKGLKSLKEDTQLYLDSLKRALELVKMVVKAHRGPKESTQTELICAYPNSKETAEKLRKTLKEGLENLKSFYNQQIEDARKSLEHFEQNVQSGEQVNSTQRGIIKRKMAKLLSLLEALKRFVPAEEYKVAFANKYESLTKIFQKASQLNQTIMTDQSNKDTQVTTLSKLLNTDRSSKE